MSERILRFFSEELKVMRVHCQHPSCGAVVELPLANVEQVYKSKLCPVCEKPLVSMSPDVANPIDLLAHALQMLLQHKDRVKVEFTLKQED